MPLNPVLLMSIILFYFCCCYLLIVVVVMNPREWYWVVLNLQCQLWPIYAQNIWLSHFRDSNLKGFARSGPEGRTFDCQAKVILLLSLCWLGFCQRGHKLDSSVNRELSKVNASVRRACKVACLWGVSFISDGWWRARLIMGSAIPGKVILFVGRQWGASRQHSSMAPTSVPAARFLLWVPTLNSFDDGVTWELAMEAGLHCPRRLVSSRALG